MHFNTKSPIHLFSVWLALLTTQIVTGNVSNKISSLDPSFDYQVHCGIWCVLCV